MRKKGQSRPLYIVAGLVLAALGVALVYTIIEGELQAGADMAMQLANIG
ncbi:MAG: hypothetical protein ABEJ07_01935 [Candidatus Nanohaloarchaea archaeon]